MTRDERVAISILNAYKEGYESAIEDYKQEPCNAISREDAKSAICMAFSKVVPSNPSREVRETLNLCKENLEQLPPITPKPIECDDAICRKAVDELSKELVHTTRDKADFLCNFWEGLQKLPTVTPSITREIEKSNFSQEQYLLDTDSAYQIGYEQGKKDGRPKGHWIDYSDEGYVECPFCGHATNCEDDIDELHYCFYCGAKMESEDKE